MLGYGGWQLYHLPIDVFPDLNRPRVTVMTEAPGMAPEEVETLVTFPLESALNGATGVQAVRSSSGIGLSVVNVEFDWGTDIYVDRQIVAEKLSLAADRLPEGVKPQMAPDLLGHGPDHDHRHVERRRQDRPDGSPHAGRLGRAAAAADDPRRVPGDHDGRRAQAVPGAGQPDRPAHLRRDAATRSKRRCGRATRNATGGYLDAQGPNEYLVRSLGRLQSVEDLRELVVKIRGGRPVLLSQVARVVEGPEVKRGDSAALVRQADGRFAGGPAVLLTITKQPGADTRRLTEQITAALDELKTVAAARHPHRPRTLPAEEVHRPGHRTTSIDALRDGGILVVDHPVPVPAELPHHVHHADGHSAVDRGHGPGLQVVRHVDQHDDARRAGRGHRRTGGRRDRGRGEHLPPAAREPPQRQSQAGACVVVFEASAEIRNSIVFSTILVVLVFIPLFALSGMEGRLFTPLGIAYIVSILASLFVSLTVTPVLSYWLLPQRAGSCSTSKDGFVLRWLKWLAGLVDPLQPPPPVADPGGRRRRPWRSACVVLSRLGRDFLPPFNEGVAQINVLLPPGTSLETSNRIAGMVEQRLQKIAGVVAFGRRTGRAELDEHAEGVNMSEIIVSFDPNCGRSREEILADIREALTDIPGVVTGVEQPLPHLISPMLSGVKAQVAIKLYGDNLDVLRAKAQEMKTAIAGVPGVKDLMVEPQIEIPQLRIELDRNQLARYGLTPGDVNELVETAMNGRVVSEVAASGSGRSTCSCGSTSRSATNLEDAASGCPSNCPRGGTIPLGAVANIVRLQRPEHDQPRETSAGGSSSSATRPAADLVDVVRDIQQRLEPDPGVAADRLFHRVQRPVREPAVGHADDRRCCRLVSLVCMFLALYTHVPLGQLCAAGDGRAADGRSSARWPRSCSPARR